jgi:hypothetical protein
MAGTGPIRCQVFGVFAGAVLVGVVAWVTPSTAAPTPGGDCMTPVSACCCDLWVLPSPECQDGPCPADVILDEELLDCAYTPYGWETMNRDGVRLCKYWHPLCFMGLCTYPYIVERECTNYEAPWTQPNCP